MNVSRDSWWIRSSQWKRLRKYIRESLMGWEHCWGRCQLGRVGKELWEMMLVKIGCKINALSPIRLITTFPPNHSTHSPPTFRNSPASYPKQSPPTAQPPSPLTSSSTFRSKVNNTNFILPSSATTTSTLNQTKRYLLKDKSSCNWSRMRSMLNSVAVNNLLKVLQWSIGKIMLWKKIKGKLKKLSPPLIIIGNSWMLLKNNSLSLNSKGKDLFYKLIKSIKSKTKK